LRRIVERGHSLWNRTILNGLTQKLSAYRNYRVVEFDRCVWVPETASRLCGVVSSTNSAHLSARNWDRGLLRCEALHRNTPCITAFLAGRRIHRVKPGIAAPEVHHAIRYGRGRLNAN